MKSIEIAGVKREGLAKQDTKTARKNDLIPCVLYGGSENVHFTVAVLDVRKLIYTPEVYMVKLNIDGKTYDAVMREIQSHPVTDKLLHIDFIEVNPEKAITLDIPVNIVGTSEGQKQGGKLVVKMKKLQIKALAKDIPDAIELDVTPLNIGQDIRVKDVAIKGVQLLDSPNNIIVGIRVTRNVVETPAEAAKAAAPPAAAAATAK
ncbi:MAG TPA: 50S ribosomal protein L25/general stress protein Ctc [Bacteroidia bacterium]|nr:50S ribosomal protein L25/general stress protein Ctc [Bacteroidia bacterium]